MHILIKVRNINNFKGISIRNLGRHEEAILFYDLAI